MNIQIAEDNGQPVLTLGNVSVKLYRHELEALMKEAEAWLASGHLKTGDKIYYTGSGTNWWNIDGEQIWLTSKTPGVARSVGIGMTVYLPSLCTTIEVSADEMDLWKKV